MDDQQSPASNTNMASEQAKPEMTRADAIAKNDAQVEAYKQAQADHDVPTMHALRKQIFDLSGRIDRGDFMNPKWRIKMVFHGLRLGEGMNANRFRKFMALFLVTALIVFVWMFRFSYMHEGVYLDRWLGQVCSNHFCHGIR